MAHAYTPGLKVTEGVTIDKKRMLPLKGEGLIQVGNAVASEDVVAKAEVYIGGNYARVSVL